MLAWLVSKYIKQVDNKTVDIVVVVPCGTVLLEWKMPVVAFSNYINAILSSHLVSLYISYFPFWLMHYLFLPSLLAALVLPLSVIAAQLCDAQKRPVVASAWYEGWAAQNITPAMIPMNLLNRVIVAFALVSFLSSTATSSCRLKTLCRTTTNDTSTMVSVDAETVAALKEIVQLAKKNVRMIFGWILTEQIHSDDYYRQFR